MPPGQERRCVGGASPHFLTTARDWFLAQTTQAATSHDSADLEYARQRILQELQELPSHWKADIRNNNPFCWGFRYGVGKKEKWKEK